MLARGICILFTFIAALALPNGQAEAQATKYALVVGVKDYPKVITRKGILNLKNPENDTTSISALLQTDGLDLDFKVTHLAGGRNEATRANVIRAWDDLVKALKPGDTALLYFAGHGVELQGRNFLLPQDAEYNSSNAKAGELLIRSSIDFQVDVIEKLARKQKENRGIAGIFIIDACRENPLKPGQHWPTDVEMGLKAAALSEEMFIMYSTGVLQEALDATEANNSVFALKLKSLLEGEGRRLALSDLAQMLRYDVSMYARSKGYRQTPAYYDQFSLERTITGKKKQVDLSQLASTRQPGAMTRSLTGGNIYSDCAYCPETVSIPMPEAFEFGSATSDPLGTSSEWPRLKATFPKDARAVAIGRLEVTNREWNACVQASGCKGGLHIDTSRPYNDRLPVTGVSYQDALDFVGWLSKDKGKYRLPTEAEWEFAARGNSEFALGFNGGAGQLCDYANGADQEAGVLSGANLSCSDKVGRNVAQVESYKPNNFGLHDMLGNVWEWTSDCWYPSHDGHPKGADGMIDASKPREAADGNCDARVVKGGSWRSGPDALRPAARNTFPVGHGRATLGFRVVREIDDVPSAPAPAAAAPPAAP